MTKRPLVAVVDDDISVRESIPDLLLTFGFACKAFASAGEFLDSDCLDLTDCVVLDMAMPGMTGPELHAELRRLRRDIPIVFITAHVDESLRVQVLEQGAAACLHKPFTEKALLGAINHAIGHV